MEKYGPKKWSTIAQHLPGRIGKQCRERYDLKFLEMAFLVFDFLRLSVLECSLQKSKGLVLHIQ